VCDIERLIEEHDWDIPAEPDRFVDDICGPIIE
jgi:hypothetical protein